jgi:sugar phosphate isomerase/epimerase
LSAQNADRKGDVKIKGNNKINCSVACLGVMDHRFLIEEMNYVNCPGYEFMVYTIWTDHSRDVIRELKSAGFKFDSMHGPKHTGRLLSETDDESHNEAIRLIKESIEIAHELDIHILTTHLWDQNSVDPKLSRNLESLYSLKDYAIDHGVNISVEFIPHTKGGGYVPTAEYLYNNLDTAFSFTLDLEFAAWDMEIADVAKFASRISNVHIRDYNGSPVDASGRRFYCLPGMGKTDFAFAFSELKRHGYKGIFTLEARHYSTKDINESLELLNNAMES